MKIPEKYQKVRNVSITRQELIDFESKVKEAYESGNVKGPIHLAKNNEDQLIEIFQYISEDDWVFVPWRNHYHALLHGVDPDKLFNSILDIFFYISFFILFFAFFSLFTKLFMFGC